VAKNSKKYILGVVGSQAPHLQLIGLPLQAHTLVSLHGEVSNKVTLSYKFYHANE